ncbi:hypothetical protein [Actinoplanes sp. ATCC 53533]|nr:hypothetical protein [Actinoplanes sp. ATCC 53533]
MAASPGHASLFSAAADIAVIGQLMLGGGTYDGSRPLSAGILKRA